MWKSCTLTVLAALTLGRLQAAAADDQIQYSRDVRPILAEHCFQCHGPDDEKRESGLRLDTRDGALALADSGRAAIKAGDPHGSELWKRITATDDDVTRALGAFTRPWEWAA